MSFYESESLMYMYIKNHRLLRVQQAKLSWLAAARLEVTSWPLAAAAFGYLATDRKPTGLGKINQNYTIYVCILQVVEWEEMRHFRTL